MFKFGKSLMTMKPEDQKNALKSATGAQRQFASEMGIGSNQKYGQDQQRQQKRDAFHDLDRLNHVVEKENEAHDFFGGLLGDWQKGVTDKSPSKDATNLKRQFDDYEHGILSELPKDGKRHSALSESLPKIKDGFLKQGHQFAVNKLNERSRSVLGNGLKRIAKDALGAKTDEEFQQHDDRAAGLINKYVLSEAKFDEKDADVFYDQFLKDAGVPSEAELKAEQAAGQIESVSGEANDSWAGKAQLNAQPSKDEIAAEETKAKNAELQIPEGQDEVYEDNQYRGKVKAQKPQEGDQKPQDKTSDAHAGLGELSEKYESGKAGSHAISSGEGDLGGKSYGKYQMTSRHNGKVGGTAQEFVNSEGFPWKDEFEGLTPASAEFDRQWDKITDEHPEEFEKLQDQFIYDSHYLPVAKSVQEYGIDADKHSKTLQQVFWSTGVQHGPNTNVVKKAVEKLKGENRFDPSSKEFEANLIDAIYEERKTRFPSSPKKIRENIQKRFDREKRDALDALKRNQRNEN